MLRKFIGFISKILRHIRRAGRWLWQRFVKYWRDGWWHKTVVVFWAAVLLCVGTMYGIARWYAYSEKDKPLTIGVSFIPSYAAYLGVDPQQTMDALINEMGVKNFRLVSYWEEIEPEAGKYDFSQLDWQFAKAEDSHAKITLSIGLRQPRWPECHAPKWVDTSQPYQKWLPQLESFMTKAIERYKNSPSLESYQLENEYFNKFGQCRDSSRSRLISEFNLVKKLDNRHPVIISRSNNYPNLPLGQPQPDVVGMSVYRRVWEGQITHRYFEYPLPAWYYGFLAGAEKIATGKDSIIHELQAEPWPPNGQPMTDTSLAEQNKSLNAERLKNRFDFGKNTGMRTMYLWGAEYWYYRKQILRDPSVWNVAKAEFTKSQ